MITTKPTPKVLKQIVKATMEMTETEYQDACFDIGDVMYLKFNGKIYAIGKEPNDRKRNLL